MIDIEHHKAELASQGISKIEALVPAAKVEATRNEILKIATDFGLYDMAGWRRSSSRFTSAKDFRSAINGLVHSGIVPDMISHQLVELAQDLVGEPVTPLPPGQQILFTLPGAASWSVPHDVWHVDAPRMGDHCSPGLQLFTFLDDVGPKAGGTLVIAGSHRLLNHSGRLRSKEIKRRLRAKPYFRSLFDPGREPIVCLDQTGGVAGEVDLKVVELTGKAGDAYFMDLRVLHSPAPNASDKARLMLTCRLPRLPIAAMLHS